MRAVTGITKCSDKDVMEARRGDNENAFVLGGVGKPVAVKIWSGVQATSDPTIAAASAILIGLAILTFASAAATQSLARRRL